MQRNRLTGSEAMDTNKDPSCSRNMNPGTILGRSFGLDITMDPVADQTSVIKKTMYINSDAGFSTFTDPDIILGCILDPYDTMTLMPQNGSTGH